MARAWQLVAAQERRAAVVEERAAAAKWAAEEDPATRVEHAVQAASEESPSLRQILALLDAITLVADSPEHAATIEAEMMRKARVAPADAAIPVQAFDARPTAAEQQGAAAEDPAARIQHAVQAATSDEPLALRPRHVLGLLDAISLVADDPEHAATIEGEMEMRKAPETERPHV